jgi:hypothetical protein
MELTITTPAILFPTISLLMLAYTNRFVAIGTRIRALHKQYKEKQNKLILIQIKILRLRIRLIRDLQVIGVFSFFLCVLTIVLIFEEYQVAAKYVFTGSLLLLMISFGLSAWEIIISTKALSIQLLDLEVKELENEGVIQPPPIKNNNPAKPSRQQKSIE